MILRAPSRMDLQHTKGLSVYSYVGLFAIGLVGSALSQDPFLFAVGTLVLAVFLYFFYSKTVPPILLMSAFFQWLFFHGKLLDGLLKGKGVGELIKVSSTMEEIVLLGFVGTTVFFVGVFVAVRNTPVLSYQQFHDFGARINFTALVRFYITIYIFLFTMGNLIWLFPGLSQPLFILTLFRWSVFFLLFITCFTQNRGKGTLLILILIDVLVGFFSFFSHFKEVIYFSFLSYWIFVFRGSIRKQWVLGALVVVTFYMGIYWTAIKDDYRDFLNQGTGEQAVLIDRVAAYSKLIDLIANVDEADLANSSDVLINRLSWIGAFDAVYRRVPDKVPHEEGALWWNGITRPFKPRLFFPEKTGLADSKELNYYSNLKVDEKKTSISLSMMVGSYVDFGIYGMHIPLFLFGLFCGWVYSIAIRWGRSVVVGYSMAMPIIYLMQINEQSINRMVSAMVLYLLVLWFVQRFLLNEFLAVILPNTGTDPRIQKPKATYA